MINKTTTFGYVIEIVDYLNKKQAFDSCFFYGLTPEHHDHQDQVDNYLNVYCGGADVFKTKASYERWLNPLWTEARKHNTQSTIERIRRDLLLSLSPHLNNCSDFSISAPTQPTSIGDGKIGYVFEFDTRITNVYRIMEFFDSFKEEWIQCCDTGYLSYSSRGFCGAYPVKIEGSTYTELVGTCSHDWKKTSDLMQVGTKVVRSRECTVCGKEEINEVVISDKKVSM